MATLAIHSIPFENYQTSTRRPQIDLAAFNELVQQYQDVVFRQALWILGDEAAAEDAAQEAFLRAYCKIDSYNGGPFRPWILRIVTNYCYDQLRREKIRKTVPLEIFDDPDRETDGGAWMKDTGATVEELYDRAEDQDRVMRSIQRLSPEYKSAVLLVDVEGLDYQEASEVLGIPLGTFKSRLSRAREKLQLNIIKTGYSRLN